MKVITDVKGQLAPLSLEKSECVVSVTENKVCYIQDCFPYLWHLLSKISFSCVCVSISSYNIWRMHGTKSDL